MADKTESVPPGASPGYQVKERFPTPEPLPTVPEPGTMTAVERFDRVLLNLTRIARGMANTAPARGDSMGPQWHELACDLEAHCKETGRGQPKVATPDRPIEMREAPVQTMLHTPGSADPVQMQILAALDLLIRKIG